jgi:hypothetical protein
MEHINDQFLMTQSNLGTRVLLDKGMPIDTIFKLVKNYQRCYICIKTENPALALQFLFVNHMELVIKKILFKEI